MRYTGHKVFLNGKLTDLSSDLMEFMEGRNIYEVIRIIDGKILFWKDHLIRLGKSLQIEDVRLNLSDMDFIEMISVLIRQNRYENMNIRIDVFVSDITNIIIGFIPTYYPDTALYDEGVKTVTLNSVREDPAVKVVHNALKSRVDKILTNRKIFEVLFLNEAGNLTEGSRTNLFLIKGKEVFTAKSEDVLLGVTRNKVIELCHLENIPVHECDLAFEGAADFDACFLTGTSPKVLPVKFVDDISFPVKNGILLKIMNAYNLLISRSLYAM